LLVNIVENETVNSYHSAAGDICLHGLGARESVLEAVGKQYHAADTVIQVNGEISPLLIWGGLKCHLTVLVYGLSVYLVSLIIRIVRKPRV